jgi:N-acetylmuramoyl-L-alanine amidase CwlA
MIFERKLLTDPNSRPALRFKGLSIKPEWVGLHWTANEKEGAGADAHQRYFANGAPGPNGKKLYTSVQYVVDNQKCIQLVPDTEPAHHVGDKPRTNALPIRQAVIQVGKNTNVNYCGIIGLEMCVNGGVQHPRFPVMRGNAAFMSAYLLRLHDLPTERLIRHYDVTGKDCPKFLLKDSELDMLRDMVQVCINSFRGKSVGRVTSKELNVRSGPGTMHPVKFALQFGEPVLFVPGGPVWQEYLPGAWINTKFISA